MILTFQLWEMEDFENTGGEENQKYVLTDTSVDMNATTLKIESINTSYFVAKP